ncbi:hypothetical protein niasHS_008835 [Heterodera schachtii]|uniref:ascorbate ferrireductase (transmembrane) n=1 Tax=Heterodera schachtii TaxID=97005 RepID=A0ABD2J4T8_HETSC
MAFRLTIYTLIFIAANSAVYGQNNSSNSTAAGGGPSSAQNGISTMFLLKCHGVLMTLAWLLLAPCAILYVRFLRDPLKRILGDQLWFQVHRLLNTLTFICVLIAFICAIGATGGVWKGPTIYNSWEENLAWSSIHSLFGFIAFLLTIFQPISALFRCHPDSSARVVFNVLHAFTGYIGWLCALIAICIACVHFGLFANTSAATVLIIVFLVLLGIVALIMQIVAIQKGHQQQQEQHGTGCIGQSQLFVILALICCAIAVSISLLIIFA